MLVINQHHRAVRPFACYARSTLAPTNAVVSVAELERFIAEHNRTIAS